MQEGYQEGWWVRFFIYWSFNPKVTNVGFVLVTEKSDTREPEPCREQTRASLVMPLSMIQAAFKDPIARTTRRRTST